MGYLVHRLSTVFSVASLILSGVFYCGIGSAELGMNPPLPPFSKGGVGGFPALRTPHSEKRVDVKKGIVAFVELKSAEPSTVYVMYPTQYSKYSTTGLLDGVLELQKITWLMYPVPALLEDQTVYFVPKGAATFHVTYENIRERIDLLLKGEERLRAGMEMVVESGVSAVRLTPLIPGLKVRLDFSDPVQFVIVKTIDFARYRKGLKTFDQLYEEAILKGSEKGFHFSTTDFEDLYLLVKTPNPIRVKSVIHATKESAESGC